MQEKLNQKVLSNRLNCDVHSWRVINWPHKVFVFQHLQKMGDNTWGGKVNNCYVGETERGSTWAKIQNNTHGREIS